MKFLFLFIVISFIVFFVRVCVAVWMGSCWRLLDKPGSYLRRADRDNIIKDNFFTLIIFTIVFVVAINLFTDGGGIGRMNYASSFPFSAIIVSGASVFSASVVVLFWSLFILAFIEKMTRKASGI